MKTRIIAVMLTVLLLAPFALSAQDAACDNGEPSVREVARQARRDAANDADDFQPSWWGTGAYAASVLLSPLLGGGIVTIVGYTAEGSVRTPAARMVQAEDEYGEDYRLLDVYEEEYEETYADAKTRKQGNRALLGTGLAVGTYLAIYALALATY